MVDPHFPPLQQIAPNEEHRGVMLTMVAEATQAGWYYRVLAGFRSTIVGSFIAPEIAMQRARRLVDEAIDGNTNEHALWLNDTVHFKARQEEIRRQQDKAFCDWWNSGDIR
ncbi:hypothetical protein [Microcystis phage MJing1]|nr:hypothetical protein [Microcystis phage MJing1]